MGLNAIKFMDHGGRRHHTAPMGPHSWQQSIQQSTNIICNRSTPLKLENNVFITSNITIKARHLNNDDATTIASLASSPPSRRCLPRDTASLSSLTLSRPLQVALLVSLALSRPGSS